MGLNSARVYLSPPHITGNELKYIHEAFDSNWIAPLGPNVDSFEKELAAYCNTKDSAVLSSGTAAIHLALKLLGVGEGDFVICQSFTFAATVFPVLYLNAIPVLVDSEKATWNMDPGLLKQAISDCRDGKYGKAKEPKAIIPVHLYGMPYKVSEIHEVASVNNIPIIEDAAEALGSEYENRRAGSFGKLSILSFNGNKIITTSGGGALLSDDMELTNKARFLATQARDVATHYQHSQIGYNYRMSNILAGIGRGQLEVIEKRVKKRREIFEVYAERLSRLPGISFLAEPSDSFKSNRWLTTMIIDPEKFGASNEGIRINLEKENIESRPLWKPMHLQPIFQRYPALVDGLSEYLFNHGICLPSGSNLMRSDQNRIMEIIEKLHFAS